jgi:hypothetical protein
MRIFELLKLAVKTVRGRWTVLPLLGMAAAAFLLCFAGAILAKVEEEKAQPYEFVVSAEGSAAVGDSAITDMREISDVTAATHVLQLSVTIRTDEYAASLTLTGLDSDYLSGAFTQGGLFPDESVMPYIVLNEAACRQFLKQDDTAGTAAPDIAWLTASFSISVEGGRGIASKICGVLSDRDDADAAPAAYVSFSAAKTLLQQSGQSSAAKTAWVRVKNIGCAQAVSRQIAALGLAVTNSAETLQAGWDAELKEMAYLLTAAAFCLACAALMLAANRAITLAQRKSAFELLSWMGMKHTEISRMFALHALIVSAAGAVIGLVAAAALPSFLSPALNGTSSFTLSSPLAVVIVSFAACALSGMLPALVPIKHTATRSKLY